MAHRKGTSDRTVQLKGFRHSTEYYLDFYFQNSIYLLKNKTKEEAKIDRCRLLYCYYCHHYCTAPPNKPFFPSSIFFFFSSSLSLWSTPSPPRELALTFLRLTCNKINKKTTSSCFVSILSHRPLRPTLASSILPFLVRATATVYNSDLHEAVRRIYC